MKRGKRLTREQKIMLSKKGLNPDEYLYKEETAFYHKFIIKKTGAIKSISKY